MTTSGLSIVRAGSCIPILHPDPAYRDTDRSASRFARTVREDFKRLISDLENDTFGADILAIWESSRGSRRVGEWVDLVDLCKQRSVRIWVTTHGRLYDPANSRDRRSLLEDAVDAEYESDKSSERIRRDVRAAAEDGKPHGKNLYGYQRVYDQQTGGLERVEAHPVQAPVVQEAAQRILAGDSFYAVAKSFNERGVMPRRPTRKAHRTNIGWTGPAVKQMLTTPAYAGKREHLGKIISDAIWPALIEFETWQRLQAIMSPPERKRINDQPARHLLSGIATCGVCGGPLRVGKQNGGRPRTENNKTPRPRPVDRDGNELAFAFYYTYVCAGMPGKSDASGRMGFHVAMKEAHLDEVVIEIVLARLEKPEFVAEFGRRGQGNDAERHALLEEISGYQVYLDGLREEAANKLRFDVLLDQEERLAPKIRAAQIRLEKLTEMDPMVRRFLNDGTTISRWQEMPLADKRRLIRAVVTPIVNRVSQDQKGQRGINRDRVAVVWR